MKTNTLLTGMIILLLAATILHAQPPELFQKLLDTRPYKLFYWKVPEALRGSTVLSEPILPVKMSYTAGDSSWQNFHLLGKMLAFRDSRKSIFVSDTALFYFVPLKEAMLTSFSAASGRSDLLTQMTNAPYATSADQVAEIDSSIQLFRRDVFDYQMLRAGRFEYRTGIFQNASMSLLSAWLAYEGLSTDKTGGEGAFYKIGGVLAGGVSLIYLYGSFRDFFRWKRQKVKAQDFLDKMWEMKY